MPENLSQNILVNIMKIKETRLHIHPNYPYFGATPDGIVCCSCHGESLLEIKCPFKYRENLKGWEFDKDFPISASGEIEKSRRYYYQMQHQKELPYRMVSLLLCENIKSA